VTRPEYPERKRNKKIKTMTKRIHVEADPKEMFVVDKEQ